MSTYDPELAKIVAELNRAVPEPPREAGELAPPPRVPASTAPLDRLLALAARQGASDLLLVAGAPATLRIHGALGAASGPALAVEEVAGLVLPLLDRERQNELERERSLDFCFAREAIGRFRANVHYQRGTLAASIRLLPARVPTLESLHLPATLAQLVARRQGLLLVTGPTGCGKSSTLAALIDQINQTRRDHVVTIEDPIEFQHVNRSSIVEQIEVGSDATGFAPSLRGILRQSPDVILIGEMRDLETMAAALTAAETGHLVLSTLHTNDTAQAVSRILDAFPAGQQAQIRQQLSLALLGIVAQQLVPSADGATRWPALEILVATDAVRNLIRRGEDHQLRTQISIGRAQGMMTMEQALADLVRARRIPRETALAHCFRADDLRRLLDPA